ncbi:MAG: putative nucleotidyltransferase substrate binding domain-containing protein [Albidovulum sp.]
MPDNRTIQTFLETVHPYDALPQDELARVAGFFSRRYLAKGADIYAIGEPLAGLYLIETGGVEITDGNGVQVSLLGPRNSFGERGLMRDGLAVTSARVAEDAQLLVLPAPEFRRLIAEVSTFERFFSRARSAEARAADLTTRKASGLMTRDPVTCPPDMPVRLAAGLMRDAKVSCLGVVDADGQLVGIVTTRDLTHRVLAEGRDPNGPVAGAMTSAPMSLPPSALGSDILHLMMERRIGHVPITEGGVLVGMVTQTDLTRFQAQSSAQLIREVANAVSLDQMAAVTARIPALLAQSVGGHQPHEVTTRLTTDIADAVTRRLLAMAEAELGAPPVKYLWLACGSQGRQDQTGVSDQDNCLMLEDTVTGGDMAYFRALAKTVSDGLHACGYVYCPGDMMATNPRWCQPVRVWRDYFMGWIATPDTEAQMLASVMFDLRPIGGASELFDGLQAETLAKAARNSIFVAHMIANSLKHAPPLGLIRGLATIRSGEHRNHIDMKHSGVVPVTDLARVYALQAELAPVNTRARLEGAMAAGVISGSGGRDLIEAYDMIAETRLVHQARLVRAGQKPDNYLAPSTLSDFERSHLRDAFVVVRTMQSALGHGKGLLS